MDIRARSLALRILCLSILAGLPLAQTAGRSSKAASPIAVQVAMKNVAYHFSQAIVVRIVRLQGTLAPTRPGSIVVFDDKNSFKINLTSAEIGIGCDALQEVMNQHVFSAPDAPIKNVTIAPKNDRLLIRGQLHKKGDLAFELEGTLTPTNDGRIRFHTEHVKAVHLPLKGMLDLLGLDLAKLINTKKVQGLSSDKDDLILNPEEIFPPPHIHGKVTSVRVEGNDVVQIFGEAPGPDFAHGSGNYMAYRHGDLRFGKLTMQDADLILLDMDPQDPFDFYLDRYKEQLMAGYSKTTESFGLRVYTRDFNKLQKASSAGH